MKDRKLTRRGFIASVSISSTTNNVSTLEIEMPEIAAKVPDRLALLGGDSLRKKPFSTWPVWGNRDPQIWEEVLQSGRWNRFGLVSLHN